MLKDSWLDKSTWGDGPWQSEPDRVEWRDAATGLPCLALRHPRMGHWCGYVGVPPEHPFSGRDTDDPVLAPVYQVAHGGLTMTRHCMEDERPQRERVCHVPLPGESDAVFWLGFDCAHAFDLSPGLEVFEREWGMPDDFLGRRPYRDIDYVAAVCQAMATVIAEYA